MRCIANQYNAKEILPLLKYSEEVGVYVDPTLLQCCDGSGLSWVESKNGYATCPWRAKQQALTQALRSSSKSYKIFESDLLQKVIALDEGVLQKLCKLCKELTQMQRVIFFDKGTLISEHKQVFSFLFTFLTGYNCHPVTLASFKQKEVLQELQSRKLDPSKTYLFVTGVEKTFFIEHRETLVNIARSSELFEIPVIIHLPAAGVEMDIAKNSFGRAPHAFSPARRFQDRKKEMTENKTSPLSYFSKSELSIFKAFTQMEG